MKKKYIMLIDYLEDIEDPIRDNNVPYLQGLFGYARESIKKGWPVRIVENYDNQKEPEILDTISNIDGLSKWEKKINRILININSQE